MNVPKSQECLLKIWAKPGRNSLMNSSKFTAATDPAVRFNPPGKFDTLREFRIVSRAIVWSSEKSFGCIRLRRTDPREDKFRRTEP